MPSSSSARASAAPAGRRVIVHEDDVGMCHGANVAFLDLFRRGICTSGSVMVPCPWFPEIAEAARNDPGLDLGVHFTLTSEKRHYRWGPLSKPTPAAGLTDADGYFWNNVGDLRRRAHPQAVEAEMRAQVDRALAMGIDVTHFDAHQYAAMAPEFVSIYARLGREYRVPVMLPRHFADLDYQANLGEVDLTVYPWIVDRLSELDHPLMDIVSETPWRRDTDAASAYRRMLSALPAGLSFLALHFNAPGEIEAIEPGSAHIRTEEYAAFASPDFAAWLQDQDLRLVGFREFRAALRSRLPAPKSVN
jgi:predicted glycoside hydrolase/deacetylase ChbG (UPF0249 family)